MSPHDASFVGRTVSCSRVIDSFKRATQWEGLLTDQTVHGLAKQVGVPAVPAVLLDQGAAQQAQAGMTKRRARRRGRVGGVRRRPRPCRASCGTVGRRRASRSSPRPALAGQLSNVRVGRPRGLVLLEEGRDGRGVLDELLAYWARSYDWRADEDRIRAWPCCGISAAGPAGSGRAGAGRSLRSCADVAREHDVSWWSVNRTLIVKAAEVLGAAPDGVRRLGVDETLARLVRWLLAEIGWRPHQPVDDQSRRPRFGPSRWAARVGARAA